MALMRCVVINGIGLAKTLTAMEIRRTPAINHYELSPTVGLVKLSPTVGLVNLVFPKAFL